MASSAVLPPGTGDTLAGWAPSWRLLNQKGGVGKTTVTLGLAHGRLRAQRRVLVVDLDPQASATWALGVEPAEAGGDVGPSDRRIACRRRRRCRRRGGAGLEQGRPRPRQPLQHVEQGDAARLRRALATLQHSFDAVLLDCSTSLGNLIEARFRRSSAALLVVEPTALSLRGIGAVADAVDEVWDEPNPDLELSGVVVNKYRPGRRG
jgi:cellulose biosynthesis protein BcsQ